ncbi:MAG: ABC transporter permease [Gammaproteobacteria bacterium]|jgi:peptide/nickel transport system permease protein
MKIIFLWTDIIFYLMLIGISILWIYQKNNPHNNWRYVWTTRVGMSTSLILLFYVVIALLDSIHFQLAQSIEVLSILDVILSPLNIPREVTYLPPFSSAKWHDVLTMVFSQLPLMLGIFLLFFASIFLLVRKNIWQSDICYPTLLVTVFVLIFILISMYVLSRHYHIFGTDKIGQDVFYQAMKSIRTGIMIGTLTTIVMLPFALMMGTMAGYFRGYIDDVIQYIYTTLSSIPSVLLIVASVLMLEVFMSTHPEWFSSNIERADVRLLALCIILGITSWTSLCRLIRAETLKIRELDYVMAARALGVKHYAIILQHILPNLMHIILITIVLDFSGLVLAEAVLSYIGVGVDPTMYSFGNMINSARLELAQEPVVWWSLSAAFIFMFVLVLSANLFADVVRDALDPKLQQGI